MWYDQMFKKGRKAFLSYLNHDQIRDMEIKTTLGQVDEIMIPSGRDPQEALVMFNRVGEIRWNSILFYVKARVFNENWSDEKEFIRFYEIERIILVGDYGVDELEWSEFVGPKSIDPNDQFHSAGNKQLMSEESAIWYQYESDYFTKWLDISSYLCRRFVKDSPVGTEINEDTALNILVIPRQAWPESMLYQDAINRKVI